MKETVCDSNLFIRVERKVDVATGVDLIFLIKIYSTGEAFYEFSAWCHNYRRVPIVSRNNKANLNSFKLFLSNKPAKHNNYWWFEYRRVTERSIQLVFIIEFTLTFAKCCKTHAGITQREFKAIVEQWNSTHSRVISIVYFSVNPFVWGTSNTTI